MLFASHSRHQSKRWFWLMLLCAVSISVSSLVIIGARAKNTWPNAAGAREARAKRNSQQSSGLRPEAASSVQLSAESYNVSEGDGIAQINVTRTGDTSGAASVDYTTLDGTAGQRTKYEIAAGTINFAAGETTKTITLLINDNNYVDGSQTFYLSLSNAGGAGLGLPALSTITITDNDVTPPTANLLEDARAFVRQHYYDFLNRFPDQVGLDYWTSQITQCGTDALCLHNKRIDVSNAFFYELEYQQTGAYVFRLYRAAYGNLQPFPNPDSSNQAEANKLPSYALFAPDRARVVGGANLSQGQLDAANAFAQRPEFLAKYPASQDGPTFIEAIVANIKTDLGVDLMLQRDALNNLFNSGGRGAVLYRLADDNAQTNPINNRALIDEEYNRAFVATQYFGYLRRDADIGGLLFWLGQVNSAPLRDVPKQHAMVCSFITSEEYQERFSPIANRSNVDCQLGAPTGNHPPSVNAGLDQMISLPQNTATLSGLVTDDGLPTNGALTVIWSKAIGPGTVNFSNANLTTTLATFSVEGTYLLRLFASDGQLTNAAFVRVRVLPANVPPDPHDVAPPIDETVATNIYDATKFLYSGNPPIQTGVAPGTIKPIQAAVLRGRVIARDNSPLPGAKITILNRPEFGQTYSRADGVFDMVVNGGGLLTVNYSKDGYLPLQRQMNVPWQNYSMVHDVSMIPFDANVTAINLTSSVPIQVARGGMVLDSPARRQSTLLFKQGTTSTITLPNGSTQPLTTLHVRATEYTVGQMGPAAMPGDLPPASQYTYAAEYSVDEAVAANATGIAFNQPVVQYNENFLNFPIGTVIPSGSYDKTSGVWVPSTNGLVIKIISVTTGLANIDIDGSGNPASDSALTLLGINTAERQQLAAIYTVGQSLWRVPLNHFSGYDFNLGFGPPGNANPGNEGPPRTDDPNKTDCPKLITGASIIGCENQSLGETVNITGTSFFLSYSSDRQVGQNVATIPLSGSSVPASLKRIDLTIECAGRTILSQSFPSATNQQTSFAWDGKDVYGRMVQGSQPATFTVGYVYDGVYEQTERFGYSGNGVPITADRTRKEVTLPQITTLPLGHFDVRPIGLGGWNLSVHHVYDLNGATLFLGDGRRRKVANINAVISTVVDGSSGDGINPADVAVGPDGSLFVVDNNTFIRRIDRSGAMTTIAGIGNQCAFGGDGGPATQAGICATNISVAKDGSIYFYSFFGARIRKIDPAGIITTVAGNGGQGFSGDGGPATQAQIGPPTTRPRPASDGSFYFGDLATGRVRRVGPDGIIATVAGNGSNDFGTDGVQATQTSIAVSDIALGPDGSLYIVDGIRNRVRRVGLDGVIQTVAGGGSASSGDADGIQAKSANLRFDTDHIEVAPDGTLYFTENSSPASPRASVRRVRADGILSTVAGNRVPGFSGDGGPAAAAQFSQSVGSLNLGPDGNLYIADLGNRRVRRVAPPLPGYTASDFLIPSEDSSEVYHFASNGKHLSTTNALSGATIYTFTYNSAGLLTQVTDGDGNITTIERDGSGNPTGIVSPYNQRTSLTVDSNGYLSRITDPASQSYQFSSTNLGLLTGEIDTRGNTHSFNYDSLGRLIKDTDPATGVQMLLRTDQGQNYSVAFSTAMNRTSSYQVQHLPSDDLNQIETEPSGLQTLFIQRKNAVNNLLTSDGTIRTQNLGADELSLNLTAATTSSVASCMAAGGTCPTT